MKKAIFSVLIGPYDILREAPRFAGWDTILFTDQEVPEYLGWMVRKVETTSDARKESRRYKILSHQFLPEYSLVCYIDMNLRLKNCPPEFPFWFRHPRRKTVQEEINKVLELGKDKPSPVNQFISYARSLGFTDTSGLFQNGFFCRRHSQDINRLHECWWEMVERYSHRDQLSLPYAVWKTGIGPENLRTGFQHYIDILPHEPKPIPGYERAERLGPIVHHITPGRSDKDLGKAINQLIEGLPEGDWICVRDIDTIPPHHRVFFELCERIAAENKADLISCMTNRLGLDYQLVDGKKSENTEFRTEIQKAEALYERYGSRVVAVPDGKTVAGLMMLFSKATWAKAGKFPEGGIQLDGKFIDWLFSERVKAIGGKLAIAKGVYLFHNYRLWSRDTRQATQHLL
jgi:hypothetical protein